MRSGHLLFQTPKRSLARRWYKMKQGFLLVTVFKEPTLFRLEMEQRQRVARSHTHTPGRHGPSSDLPQPGLLPASLTQAYGRTHPFASRTGCGFASSSQTLIPGTRRARRSRWVQWPCRRSARQVNAQIKHACPTHSHPSTSPEPSK